MELFLTLGYIFFMIIICIIVIIITIATAILKIPVVKGFIGETVIKSIIGKTQPGEKYVVNDLMITDENGKSSQIDHILINRNGIYVIETKNYSGRIYGNNMQREWTQVLNYGKTKNKFYNPVKQNLTHIYRIREVTGTKIPIKSIVVFVKGNTKYIDSKDVYTPFEMKQEIQKSNFQQLKINEMKEIYDQLMEIKNNPKIDLTDHKENINKTIEGLNEGICPRCYGKLVKRKSSYGEFYGCSNYPNCKFKKKI